MFTNYDASKFDPKDFEVPPPGKYKARIEEAIDTYSKAGNSMIKVKISLDEHPARVHHYLVDNEYIQQNLDRFLDCFSIRPGDFDLANWEGKQGEVIIKIEEFNGSEYPRVAHFILKKKQDTDSVPARTPQMYSDADESAIYEENYPFPDFSQMSDANEDVPFPGEFSFPE